MSPFAKSHTRDANSPLLGQLAGWAALIAFLVCLLVGGAIVAWRVSVRKADAHVRARTEAQAPMASLELQFNQAAGVAETLGLLARQVGARPQAANAEGFAGIFQTVATDLHAQHQTLASIEWQPGGVVTEIVPRAGHERIIGRNVLNDPAQRASAQAAIQNRRLTLSLSKLHNGEPGLIARYPVLHRGRDGRDYFSGFVAASIRLGNAFSRSGMNGLSKRGYDYALFALNPGGQQPTKLAGAANVSYDEGEKHGLRIHNFVWVLAVQPRSGWLNTTKAVLESLGVLLVSGLIGLLVNAFDTRREMESSLADLNRRINREMMERKEAEEQCRGARDESAAAQVELKRARAAAQESQTMLTDLQEQLQQKVNTSTQGFETAQAKVKEAEAKVKELHARLQSTIGIAEETAQARQAELDVAQAALRKADQANKELRSRLEELDRTARHTAGATQVRQQQDQAAITQLRTDLEETRRRADRAEEELSESNASLGKAQIELAQLRQQLAESRTASGESEADGGDPQFLDPEESVEQPERAAFVPEIVVDDIIEPVTEEPAETEQPAEPFEMVDASEPAEVVDEEPEPAITNIAPAETAPEEQTQPAEIVEPVEEVAPPVAEPRTKPKQPKSSRRKKTRIDPQMDLFGAESKPEADPDPGEQTDLDDPPHITMMSTEEELPSDTEELALEVDQDEPDADETKPTRTRHLSPAPPVNAAALRLAVSHIVPLFIENDPGAKDCLKDHRDTFRSAFNPEGYNEFEQLVRKREYTAALDQLKKAARKHGISI